MQTILAHTIAPFMQRFENFSDAEFRSLEILSPTNIQTTFALQDASRDFDWITITLSFSDVVDASLIDANQTQHLDTSEGATLEYDGTYRFKIQGSTFFIQAKNLKYTEGSF
jgi:hypothetical protein